MEPPTMKPGTAVRITGLVSRPELNGASGVVAGVLSDGRYPVQTAQQRGVNAVFRLKPNNVVIDSAALMSPASVFAAFFSRESAYDVLQAKLLRLHDEGSEQEAAMIHDQLFAEIDRMGRVWSKMDFLGRQRFFMAVRASRRQWPEEGQGPAYAGGPDGLLLDLFEHAALSADGEKAFDCFVGTAKSMCGARQHLITRTEFWYKLLEDRELPLAVKCLAEKPSKEVMEDDAIDFCLWLARYATRWLEAIGKDPELVVCNEALVLSHFAPRRLSSTQHGPFIPTPEHARLAQAVASLASRHGSCKLAFIKVERLKMWIKAEAEDAAALGGRVIAGTTYRPFSLQFVDVCEGEMIGQLQAATMLDERPLPGLPKLEHFSLAAPTPGELLSTLLVMLRMVEKLPNVLAFDCAASEHAAALSPFLFNTLRIRCTCSSLELPIMMQDTFDELNEPVYDDCSENKMLAPSPFQWKATPLLETKGATVDLVDRFHAAAAAYSVSKVWGDCRVKLGVLVPGSPWRLGVPMGWSGQIAHGGFAIDEYTSPTNPEPLQMSAMPGFMMMTEDNVPFADVDAAEEHGFQVEDGLYPVPAFCDTESMTFSLRRPGALDLTWMIAALPAVTAFIEKHGFTKTQTARHLTERLESTGAERMTYAIEETGVVVCFPPPSCEWMPDRPGNDLIPVAMN